MIRVGIIGATGYSGIEAVRIVAGHPQADVAYITSTSEAGTPVAALYPGLHRLGLTFEEFNPDAAKQRADVFLLCLPHGQSAKFAVALLDQTHKVIDLSADFRLAATVYEQWYGAAHPQQELLRYAVYGLPELNKDAIAQASLVANPGCYPTGAALALAPAVSEGIIHLNTVVVDSKSGVSGAGRTPTTATHFCEVSDRVKAYNVGSHRHTPEIERVLTELAGTEVHVTFAPHLVPMNRGILTSAYAAMGANANTADVVALYREFYDGAPFVTVLEPGLFPSTGDVAGSNDCLIGIHVDERTGRLVVISAIDNLIKGAAGQAVQNLNLMYGIDEISGLKLLGRTV